MAAFGWNLRRVNNMQPVQFSQARQTRPTLPGVSNQIACRICNQVFTSTQALIDHIECHMIRDETLAAVRRQQPLEPLSLFSSHTHREFYPNPYNIPPFSPRQFDNLRRHHHHHHQVPQPMQYPSHPPLVMSQEPNRFPIFNNAPVSMPVSSSQLSLYNRNNHHFSQPQPQIQPPAVAPRAGYQGQQRSTMQHSPPNDDYTKPFLSQMEKMREIERDRGRSNFDALPLDLTLKL